jgi:hypothetical protein
MRWHGQAETSDRITTVKLSYQVEHHLRQKYRCACNGAVVTAPGPLQVLRAAATRPHSGSAWRSRNTRITCRWNAK